MAVTKKWSYIVKKNGADIYECFVLDDNSIDTVKMWAPPVTLSRIMEHSTILSSLLSYVQANGIDSIELKKL